MNNNLKRAQRVMTRKKKTSYSDLFIDALFNSHKRLLSLHPGRWGSLQLFRFTPIRLSPCFISTLGVVSVQVLLEGIC